MLTLDGTNKIVAENLSTEVTTLLTPKNWIINGGFDVWQRGTSFTNFADGTFSADRWVQFRDGTGATSSISREAFTVGQTDVPNNPTYFLRYAITAAGTSNTYRVIDNRIEDVSKLSGKTISLSFWAKADTNRTINAVITQYFGSGGSADVGTSFGAFNITTSWQRLTKTITLPSIIGKTIGTNHFSYIRISVPSGTTLTFDIANVSLVEGSVPVEWQTEAYADVLRDCCRYYVRYQNQFNGVGVASASTSVYSRITFPTIMRIVPTPAGGGGSMIISDDYTNNFTASTVGVSYNAIDISIYGARILLTGFSGLTTGRFYAGAATGTGYIEFNAEL